MPRSLADPALSRRSALLGSLLALLSPALLAACADDVEPQTVGGAATEGPSTSALAPATPAPLTPAPAAASAPQPVSEIRALLDSGPEPVVAGQKVDAALLRRFYERHDFAPVWPSREAAATSLVNAVLRAGDQGLDPEMFHGGPLRSGAPLAPLDREVLMSDAFLTYADALANGAVPAGRRRDDQTLAPPPVDVTATLDEAMDKPDPGAAIEALAPDTPTYRALRAALQKARTAPLSRRASVAAASGERVRKLSVNLERQRWLPRPLPADRVWVNVAAEKLVLYHDDLPVFTTRVVVGQDPVAMQSPEFAAEIDASLYNPPWVVPIDIVRNEILPKIATDPDYLKKNKMVMLPSGEAEQLPGPEAGLGYIMFDMPNRFEVYLHDTPDRDIFKLTNRRISHGCIRVQNPREFAALLMGVPLDAINEGIAKGATVRNELPTPVPVYVVYQTAAVDADGKLQFYPDFYNRDADIWQKLQRRPEPHEQVAAAENRSTAQAVQ